MIRNVVVSNVKHKIDQSDVIGSGGEATVVRVNNCAVKIYHSPNPPRISKLQDFFSLKISLPSSTCAPIEMAYDVSGKEVGFTMRLLTGHHEVVKKLSSKSHRQSNPSITSKSIIDMMLDGYKTISACHSAGVIIGDNNDLNVLYGDKYLTYIDVDSFQFGKHPCMVGTEEFLPPELYNIDLSKGLYYKPEHDWYSWLCMLFRSILMTHPYGGVDLKHPSIPQRALAKITVFDSGVKYPKVALHPDVLDDNLKQIFDRMFKKHERFIPSVDAFAEYKESLKTCLHCDTMYPGERNTCPQCSTINTQQIQRQVKVIKSPGKRTVVSEELISVPKKIIWNKFYHKSIYCISVEYGLYVLYSKSPDCSLVRKELFKVRDQAKFDMFSGQFLVANESVFDNNILIFDITKQYGSGLCKKPVSQYGGERIFSCGQDTLFRVFEGFLMKGQYSHKYASLQESNLNAVVKNQTWISSSYTGNAVFGIQRSFNIFTCFVYAFDRNPKGEFWNFSLGAFDDNESIIDMSTHFCGATVLLMLKTEIKGRTFTRVYVIREGKIVVNYKLTSLSSDTHRNIHGKAFMYSGNKGMILHPTDDGIVQEVLDSPDQAGKQSLISETEPFVSESDCLLPYEKGIVVIGDKQVNYLTIA